MRRRGAVPAARRQLEVGTGAGHLEEHAVIAVVIAEAADLGEPEAVAVERDDLVQAVGVPGDAHLHRWASPPLRPRPSPTTARGSSAATNVAAVVDRLAVGDEDVLEVECEQGAQRRQGALLVPRRRPHAQDAVGRGQRVGEHERALLGEVAAGVSATPRPSWSASSPPGSTSPGCTGRSSVRGTSPRQKSCGP